MNESSSSNLNRKSRQRLILLWAVCASIVAVICFTVLLSQKSRVQVAGTGPGKAEAAAPDLAVQLLEAGRRPPSMSLEAYASQGFDLLLKKNDPVGAIPIFEACIVERPDYSDGYHGLAMAQREAGYPAKAVHNHDRAIELSPDRADYYRVRGMTYQRLRNFDAAIKSFEQGLEAKDTRYCAPGFLKVGLAQCYRAKGDLKKALEYNDQAIALNPQEKWFYVERGNTYRALGDPERAQADFAAAAQLQKQPR